MAKFTAKKSASTLQKNTQPKNPPLVRKARQYLLSFDGVTEEILERHLAHWKDGRQETLKKLYRKLVHHAKNRQAMPNTIGDVDRFKSVLFEFDPKKVAKNYPSHIELLGEIKKKVKTAGTIDSDNNKSHWVIYAKSVLSAAHFLKRFETAESFHDFVQSFYRDEYTRLALPLLLKEEIFGFGFALACDFLKDGGYEEFVKPDTHLNDICRAAGVTDSHTDFGVFKDVLAYCKKHDLIPYEFDKLIWLVGSGKLHLDDKKIPTNKKAFIDALRRA